MNITGKHIDDSFGDTNKWVFSKRVKEILGKHDPKFTKSTIYADVNRMLEGNFGSADPKRAGWQKKVIAEDLPRNVYGVYNHNINGNDPASRVVIYYSAENDTIYVVMYDEFLQFYPDQWTNYSEEIKRTDEGQANADNDEKMSTKQYGMQYTEQQRHEIRNMAHNVAGYSSDAISLEDYIAQRMAEEGIDHTAEEYEDKIDDLTDEQADINMTDPLYKSYSKQIGELRGKLDRLNRELPKWKAEYAAYKEDMTSKNADDQIREGYYIYPHDNYAPVIQELKKKGVWEKVQALVKHTGNPQNLTRILALIADMQARHVNTVNAVERIAAKIDDPHLFTTDSVKKPNAEDEIVAAFKARYDKMKTDGR
jgi:hypothetical protein